MLAHPASTYRPAVNGVVTRVSSSMFASVATATNDTAVGTTTIRSTVGSRVKATSSLSHGSSRTISSVTGCTTPGRAIVATPASLAGKDCGVEAIEGVGTATVDERGMTDEGNVVD
jgi:hypothetical protein